MIASVATADVSLSYDPTSVPVNVATDVAVSLVANPGFTSNIGAIIMDYSASDLAELNPTAFAFTDQFSNASWITAVSLPDTIQTVWAEPTGTNAPVIQDGQTLQFATMTLEPTAVGNWQLDAGDVEISDANLFEPLEIKGGNPSTINVTPEPASLCLLGLGALAVIRRRR